MAVFCFRYTTSPHLFSGDAEVAFARVRSKVCPVFSCYSFNRCSVATSFQSCKDSILAEI